MKKLAIIGASTGQLPLCLKAKELGLYTICFAWEKGAVCKDVVDKFYPISILEKEKILEICQLENVDGIVSNASDLLVEIVAFLTEKLRKNGNSIESISLIRNKYKVRNLLKGTHELSDLRYYLYDEKHIPFFPCVVKPIYGSSKKGVSYVPTWDLFSNAINYAKDSSDSEVLIEEYVDGKEISVESISCRGTHYVLQITDKDSSGPPHFVELGHHQPAILDSDIKCKVQRVVSRILNCVGYKNGASHIELKICGDKIYLIEINPRGGGDEISRVLVELSTGYDYIKGMIDVALDQFSPPVISVNRCSGIYYLCNQTASYYNGFESALNKDWLVETNFKNGLVLHESSNNYDRDSYLIYSSDNKVVL